MTSREEKVLVKALKALKNSPEAGLPDFDTSERMNKRVMEYVTAHGSSSSKPLHYLGFFAFLRIVQHLFSPRFVYSLAIFLTLAGIASAAVKSRNALPGEALYPAKLAVDEVKVRFISNPADRAQVQMEIAGHRLREIKEISQTGKEYNGRLNEALSRFAKDVGEAQKNLAQAGDPAQVKAATEQIAKKAQEYSQELTAAQALLEQKAAVLQQQSDTDALLTQAGVEGVEGVEGNLENLELLKETESIISKKPARSVEFSAFAQAQQALKAVSREDQEEVVTEDLSEDKTGEPLENGEVGL